MQVKLVGVMLVSAVSLLAAQGPGQAPPRGQRPGQDQGKADPGPPPGPEDEGPGGPPPPPPFGPPPNPLFMAIDSDDDGELSPKEIAAASKSILKLDKNKDGILTEDEVRPPPPPGGRRGPGGFGGPPGFPGGPPGGGPGGRNADSKALADSVMKFDKNGDGKVTAEELPERMRRMLEEGDSNKDGALQRSEIEALARRQPARRPGPPGPPPGAPDNF